MYKIVEYIKSELGIDIGVSPIETTQMKVMPFFLSELYDFYDGEIAGKHLVFAEFVPESALSPGQYAKHKKILMEVWQKPIVFVFRSIQSYNRQRMIAQRINFVVPYSMIYMPDLLIVFSNNAKDKDNSGIPQYLSPTAQTILLYYFYGTGNDFSYKEIQKSLDMPYPTVCRAIEMLVKSQLCEILGTRNKTLHFENDKKKLLEKALPLMRSPIKRVVYAEEIPINAKISGMTALSEYTFLNPDESKHVAISMEDFKMGKNYSKEDVFMPVHIEVWNYAPSLFAHDGWVDKISLYLSLKDSNDERVQHELTQMLQGLW